MEQLRHSQKYTLEEIAVPEQRRVALSERVATNAGALITGTQITVRPLPEYEPPLEPTPPAELPEIPSSADFPDLPRLDAFQLALDLCWAREHRVVEPEQRISAADLHVTRWLLTAVVEVLDRRRPLVQLRQQLDTRVFAAMETRLRAPPGTRHATYLRSVHACQPVKGVIEACGVLDQGQRARAMAARLEARRWGWLCTVLRMV